MWAEACVYFILIKLIIQLLKAIGVVKEDKKDIYQDSVTAPLNREHDDDAGDTEGFEENLTTTESLSEVLTAIPKVCF